MKKVKVCFIDDYSIGSTIFNRGTVYKKGDIIEVEDSDCPLFKDSYLMPIPFSIGGYSTYWLPRTVVQEV